MKQTFFLFLSCLFAFNCMAQTPVPITEGGEDNAEDRDIDHRSLTVLPTVAHDGNVLYLFSDICIENLQVIVTDATGSEVYSTIITLLGNKTILLPELPNGNYSIELFYEEKYLYGYFTIE